MRSTTVCFHVRRVQAKSSNSTWLMLFAVMLVSLLFLGTVVMMNFM
jgi:hypothetical protein